MTFAPTADFHLPGAARPGGAPALRPPSPPPARAPAPAPIPRPDGAHVLLGDTERGPLPLDIAKLLHGRMLVQGSSGAGKSTLLRRLVEGAHRHITTVVVDPEGEFATLAAHIGAERVSGADLAPDSLTAAALACRAHRVPLHLDLQDLEPDERILRAAAFFSGLVSAPREHWGHTVLVAIDEAHLLAPHLAGSARDAETRKAGVAALTDLCSRGRKRGIAAVVATQRLAKLATSVLSELHNVAIGLNVFDRDIARAADLLGWTYDRAATLRDLPPGAFMALGPALCPLPVRVQVGPTETRHDGATPALLASAGLDAAAARAALNLDAHAGTGRVRPAPSRGGRAEAALDAFLLEPHAPLAARVMAALRTISPNATTADELARHAGEAMEAVHAALDLLAQAGAVDTVPGKGGRIARLSARLRARASEAPVVALA